MLTLDNVSVQTTTIGPILVDIDLKILPGEIHAVIGPKHSGKSALVHTIMGHPDLEISQGVITYNNNVINDSPADVRCKNGIYLSFQHPPEFRDIKNWDLFKECQNSKKSDLDSLRVNFDEISSQLKLENNHGDLFNDSMTPAETKINELIFMLLSKPQLIMIDEIDENLNDSEIDLLGNILTDYLKDKTRSCLIITGNHKLLDDIQPTTVHIMAEGEIQMSGKTELYKRIVEDGNSEF